MIVHHNSQQKNLDISNGFLTDLGLPVRRIVILNATLDSLGDTRMRILGLGAGVGVIEPDELRRTVIETASAIVTAYG